MFSLTFIKRPKLAAVISIALFIAGAICAVRLPVSEYPVVSPAQITVTAYYAGASAEEIANTVAAPIESEVNSVEDIIYYSSKSDNSGNYSLTVTFKPGADENMALVNVNNAVKLVEPKLPQEVKSSGVKVAKQSSDMLCAMAVHSSNPKHTLIDVSTFADIRIKDALARIDGVGAVSIFGEAKRSMRCWLDPERMRALGVTIDEVKGAISSQNLQAAAGAVGTERSGTMLQYKILADGRLKTAEEFEDIVIRSDEDGLRLVHLKDIARVELGAERYNSSFRYNGEPGVMVAVYKLNQGNALSIYKQVLATMRSVEGSMPEGMRWDVAYDTTSFVVSSMEEIVVTLFETFLLVVLITWIFLQSWRATLIPTVAIPVSLVGTFLFLQLFGISINTLTMFALILVIGSVVDDAICVTEACMTKLQAGMDRVAAAKETMKEISGALVATTLVVVAVYAPIGFAQGMVGTIYLQFSITMCVALILSTLCALSLSCALAALVMKKAAPAKGFFKWFNGLYDRLCDCSAWVSRVMIRFMPLTIAAFVAIAAAAVFLYTSIPPAFVPSEDKGVLLVEITLPSGSVLARTEEVSREVSRRLAAMPEIMCVSEVPGSSMTSGTGENMSYIIAMLKSWEEREGEEHGIDAVHARVLMALQSVPEAKVVAFVPPPIMGLGIAGGVSFNLQGIAGQSSEAIAKGAAELVQRLRSSGKVLYAFTTFDASTPLLRFKLDRQRAEQMGVRVSDVFAALQGQLGSYYVNDFNLDSKNYQVNIQADLRNRASVNQVASVHVMGADGAQVPILSVGEFEWTVGPRQVERFNMFPSAGFQAQSAAGVSSGELMREIDRQVADMGSDWQVSYTDMAYQERENEGQIVWLLALSIVMAYLFLVGQYENWTVPIPVMLCVLVALCGGLAGIKFSGIPMNIYCQLGVLMLIGITAKSAILIAEYALQKEDAGVSIVEAAVEGMRQRFRSVQMTALSFVIGVLPLLFATGAGANARHAVGVATFWGMLTATVVGMLFVPPLYVFFRRLALAISGKPKTALLAAAMVVACGAARAEDPAGGEVEAPAGWNYAPGEGLAFGDRPVLSTELSLSFDSKYLSYGLVDNNDPVLTPAAAMTFFDWITFEVSAIFDLTDYGRKAGYSLYYEGNGRSRGGKYTELDPGVSIGHAFGPDDCAWLPTTVEFSLGYLYEYHSRSYNYADDDTQFVVFELSLPDLWIEPTFCYERDIDRDNGTYINLELGHAFAIVGDEESPVLTLRPSIAQGFGNRERMKGYLPALGSWDDYEGDYTEPLDHAGLMDTMVKLEAEWTICDWLALSGYVGYSDFLFDRTIRDASRVYEASGRWDESYNFVGGLALTASF